MPMASACGGAHWALSLFSLLFAAKEQPASWILPQKLLPSEDRDGGRNSHTFAVLCPLTANNSEVMLQTRLTMVTFKDINILANRRLAKHRKA
jgi:hypothetical protein